jgi:hypothetical protein
MGLVWRKSVEGLGLRVEGELVGGASPGCKLKKNLLSPYLAGLREIGIFDQQMGCGGGKRALFGDRWALTDAVQWSFVKNEITMCGITGCCDVCKRLFVSARRLIAS